MKHYKKFYEIGNNKYYTINVEDELYIATETFINIGKKRLFGKQNTLTQGLKLLKVSSPLAILFQELDLVKPINKNEEIDELTRYNKINNKDLRNFIFDTYNSVYESQILEIENRFKEDIKKNIAEGEKRALSYEKDKNINMINAMNPVKNGLMDVSDIKSTKGNIIRTMIREGYEHLYTERVTGFSENTFLYYQDDFGKITIVKVFSVKNNVRYIDTFIFDKNLVSAFLKEMYESDK